MTIWSNDDKPFRIQQETNWGKDDNHRPLIHNKATYIPWWLAEEAYKYYSKRYGTSQSLERLNERGGFGREELLMFLRKCAHDTYRKIVLAIVEEVDYDIYKDAYDKDTSEKPEFVEQNIQDLINIVKKHLD